MPHPFTASKFVYERPEFQGAGAHLVTAAMDEAARELSEADWGNVYYTALSLLTAHKLWASPFGSSMRLEGGGEEKGSRYLTQLGELQVKRIPRIMVLR
jgi:hypothetical protein